MSINDSALHLLSPASAVAGCEAISPIAARFSAAATCYQSHDKVQRLTAASLLNVFSPKGRVLDIGAGPGTDFSAASTFIQKNAHALDKLASTEVIALDIALGMLQTLKKNYPEYQAICADAEHLPIVSASIDCIYSNLALQWCGDFPAAVAEMARVLVPDGECHLSLVAQGSLSELQQLGLHVNTFSSIETIGAAFSAEQWRSVTVELIPFTVYFDNLKDVLYSIKGVGASFHATKHHSTQSHATEIAIASEGLSHAEDAPRKLRGRKDWLALQMSAEVLREDRGLPLTYQVAQIRAWRAE